MQTKGSSNASAPVILTIGLLLGLPLPGILAGGQPLKYYREFPPLTHYVKHAAFAWPAFIGLALLIILATAPWLARILFHARDAVAGAPAKLPASADVLPPGARRFPGWGWLGLIGGAAAWLLAWTRFAWFAPLQTFTFSPLWFSYIVIVNALVYRRTRQCMLTHRPRHLLRLFAASAAFWWLFEYLNRFVQNWYYVGIGALTPVEYFLFATLPFSTVLPAVMGTYELLATYPRLYAGLTGFGAMPAINARRTMFSIFIVSAAGLAGIGVWSDYLFPLLWLAPLGLLASLQSLSGRPTLLTDLGHGDWRRVALLALAALICGGFWEMWNFYSQAKWIYAVPFVNRFHIFEMPILGYAGYLPFGLECALSADWLAGRK